MEGEEPVGLKMVFVCTGNTCRSPLAEVLARQVFGANPVAASTASSADKKDPPSFTKNRKEDIHPGLGPRASDLDIEVCSAGLAAWEGQSASEHAILVAGEYGTSLNGHKARTVNEELLQTADWIIPMTKAQQERLVDMYPQFAAKIRRLGAWADDADVHDPWGGSIEQYRQTAAQIKRMLERMKEKLILNT